MNTDLVMDRVIVMALIGLWLYTSFALVDFIKAKRNKK